MVFIKAKGEYYYRELKRLENESHADTSTDNLVSIRKKLNNLEKELVDGLHCLFSQGKAKTCCIFSQ